MMKRRIFSLILALILCLGLSGAIYGSNSDFLYDEADLLTDAQERSLRQALSEISSTHEAQIVICTVDSTIGNDADYHLEYLYDSMDLGYGPYRDGVLLLLCMDLREYRILSNGYASDAIDPYIISDIGDVIVSDLSDGDYADAFHAFAEECDYYLNGYRNGFPFDSGGNLMICLIIGVVVGLIVVLILKGQLKSVRGAHQANNYVKRDSMKLRVRNDIYLYRNVVRTKRETSSSGSRSGGGGGGRSTGGGRF